MALASTALLSMLVAFVLYERSLARSLQQNSRQRLDAAAQAATLLVEDHLAGAEARYRAVAATPQVRAVLELAHRPTTQVLAEQIRSEQGALAVELRSARGRLLARSAAAATPAKLEIPARSMLSIAGDDVFAVVATDVALGEERAARLIVIERIAPALVKRWSQLCGARLSPASGVNASSDMLAVRVGASAGDGLVVVGDLTPERAALASARRKLGWAALAALLVTLAACAAVARSLVRPLHDVHVALARIGSGDLDTRIGSARGDEIGAIARDVDRMAERLVSSHREIARHLDELQRSRAHLTRAQQIARLGSFEVDLASGELAGSEEFWTLFGAEDCAKGLTIEELRERLHPADREALLEAFSEFARHGTRALADFRVRLPDGAERVLQAQFHRAPPRDGASARIEGTVQDLTEFRRAEEQIRFLAYHDPLTGLGNRALLSERMALAIPEARRRGRALGLLTIDLDDFKRVNDTLGHDVGDDVLREVADRIVRGARAASGGARARNESFEPTVVRLGGDEFAVLVTDVREPSDLGRVAEQLLRALQRPCRIGRDEVVISASIGIATWPEDGDRIEALLGNADAAMVHAKANGRNTFSFFAAAMNEVALRKLAIELRLREALERGSLALHFQPKIELTSGRVEGFEALARWRDAELGEVPPADFVAVAEQTGLIVALGRWVRESVCDAAREHATALRDASARISFNVSSRELGAGFAREVADTIAARGADPALLQIEVTETAIMRDEAASIEALRELKALGVSIAIDDFGIGYSSLAVLRRLPVDTLKIDASFVRSITQSPDAASLTRSIVAMGSALGLRIVAEGVEHPAQRTQLASWGCDAIQGFLVGSAQPAREAFALLGAAGPHGLSRSSRTSA